MLYYNLLRGIKLRLHVIGGRNAPRMRGLRNHSIDNIKRSKRYLSYTALIATMLQHELLHVRRQRLAKRLVSTLEIYLGG